MRRRVGLPNGTTSRRRRRLLSLRLRRSWHRLSSHPPLRNHIFRWRRQLCFRCRERRSETQQQRRALPEATAFRLKSRAGCLCSAWIRRAWRTCWLSRRGIAMGRSPFRRRAGSPVRPVEFQAGSLEGAPAERAVGAMAASESDPVIAAVVAVAPGQGLIPFSASLGAATLEKGSVPGAAPEERERLLTPARRAWSSRCCQFPIYADTR